MPKNKVAVNTIANLASRAWTMVANYLFVPIYISILGEEAYGLITFFATLQTALNLLGLGLSKTLRREFAADASSGKDSLYKYQILRTVETIYFFISIVIVLICFFGAEYISEQYLQIEHLPLSTVIRTVRLMGCSIAAQLLANLYLGCLFGQQRQVLADCIQILWSVIKNVGVVAVVMYVSTSVSAFYVWHVLIDLAYLVALREIVVSGLKKETTNLFWTLKDMKNIREIWRIALGVMIISVGYAINTQADKLIISGSFQMKTVGAYNSAYNLGLAASVFVAAMGIAVFPKFTNYYTAQKKDELMQEYIRSNKIANAVTISIGVFVAFFSYDLLYLWTGSSAIAKTMQIAAVPLILGTTLNALQEIPYNYYLAHGITVVNNIMTVCSIIYVIAVTPLMIRSFGLLGASLSWFIQMLVFTAVYLTLFYIRFFRGSFFKRMVIETILPIMITCAFAYLVRTGIKLLTDRTVLIVMTAIAAGAVNLIVLANIFCRTEIKKLLHKNEAQDCFYRLPADDPEVQEKEKRECV